MDMDGKILRAGAAAIVLAVFLRLFSGSGAAQKIRDVSQSDIASFLLFLQTGKVVRQVPFREAEEPEPTVPIQPQPETREPVAFDEADAANIQIANRDQWDVDIQALLTQPLSWDLMDQEGPTVLILHTHASESYLPTGEYEESSSYRTLDEGYNVISVGDRLAEILEDGGIWVLHDRTLHDYPSYNGSYENSRKTLQAYMAEYPTIRLVLDIHRDAMEDTSGNQIGYTVSTERGTSAKLMLVVGTDTGGLHHPNWEENLAVALKLHALLERENSGICRPVSLRTSRFNQDLCAGAVLAEVGAAGNSRQEALIAAEYLAETILRLSAGSP